MTTLAGLKAVVQNDLAKVARFAAVSAITVPIGLVLLWLFLQTSARPATANFFAVALATIPNYLLNRYWVWKKSGKNSVAREVLPFWAMAFVGMAVSTLFIWIADKFTDLDLVFMVVNFISFGFVWMVKFFVLERFLFGARSPELAESTV